MHLCSCSTLCITLRPQTPPCQKNLQRCVIASQTIKKARFVHTSACSNYQSRISYIINNVYAPRDPFCKRRIFFKRSISQDLHDILTDDFGGGGVGKSSPLTCNLTSKLVSERKPICEILQLHKSVEKRSLLHDCRSGLS